MLYGRVCFFPKILGELPDVLKTLDDENVKNAGQHGINFEASSIHTVIFFFGVKKMSDDLWVWQNRHKQ